MGQIGQQNHERALQDAKISNEFARMGAQSTILINGGAATASLAFIANAIHDMSAAKSVLPLLEFPLFAYALGVASAALAFLIMSDSIENYMMLHLEQKEEWATKANKQWRISKMLIVFGLFCFVLASGYIAYTFGHIFS